MIIISKIKSNLFEIVAIVAIFALLNYIFRIDYFNLTLIISSSVVFYLVNRFSIHNIRNSIILIILATVTSFVNFGSPVNMISILLGFNLASLFVQLRNLDTKTYDLSLINSIALASILLASGIEKFRGGNKLNITDIQMTVPILVGITLSVYFISTYLRQFVKSYNKHFKNFYVYINYFIAGIAGTAILIVYYKESGPDLLLIPFLAGMLVALFKVIIKNTTILNDILDIVLLIMFPFQISGFMGIAIATMTMFLSEYLLNLKLSHITTSNQMRIAQYSPLLFLFAAQEIRENEGLINRLDITNGYQMGWLLMSLIIVRFAGSVLPKFRKVLVKNELNKLIPQIFIICILVAFAIIIRSGRFEGAVAIVTAFSAYMFLTTSDYAKTHKSKPVLRFLNSTAGLVGAMSFLVLTTF